MPSPNYNKRDTAENTLNVYQLPPLPPLNLPPIPPITDPKLRNMVFTHVSAYTLPKTFHTSMFNEDGASGMDYEKLEHVGDAILETVAVTMLHELYPNFRQGGATNVRSLLVSNAVLAQIALGYNLEKDLISQPALNRLLKRNVKVQASIFEAYIAGVYYSYLGEVPGQTESPLSTSTIHPAQPTNQTRNPDQEDGEDAQPNDNESEAKGEDPQHHLSSKSPSDYPRGEDSDSNVVQEEEGSSEDPQSEEAVNSEDAQGSIEDADIEAALTDDSMHIQGDKLASIVLDPFIAEESDHNLTDSDDEEVPEQAPTPSEDTSSSDTATANHTRGEAFDYCFAWLSQVLEPIAAFVIENLKIEENRIASINLKPTPKPRFKIPMEWAEEDRKAVGGKAMLHQSRGLALLDTPQYIGTQDQSYWISESPWTVECSAKDINGKEWRAEATRMTKVAASNVAAWKICVQMGMIGEDE